MNNRKLCKTLKKMIESCPSNMLKGYVFLLSNKFKTNKQSYKGFDIYYSPLVPDDTIYLTFGKLVDKEMEIN